MPGSEHAAAAPAEPLHPRPDCSDDELWREMGVLGATRQRGVVGIVDGVLQLGDLVPTFRKGGLARAAEDAIGELRGAEAGEADQPLLLVARGGPFIGLDLRREPYRRDAVAGALLPAFGEAAVAGKMKIDGTLA